MVIKQQNSLGDAIFLTDLTGPDGKVSFSWNEYQEGDLFLTVTKEISDQMNR